MGDRRAIIHVDMDAFYASVEQRDDPGLRGRPLAVGGDGERGVVAAASYEARRFGVRSAMPSRRARERCPELIFVRPRMSWYREVSGRVFSIFRRFTPLVEPLSLDEAFLDVTASRSLHGTAVSIARAIKREIQRELQLVASVGIAPNKFLAKLASDIDKPDGFALVRSREVRAFLDPLPIERMWGVGPKSAPRLRGAGFETLRDLRRAHPGRLAAVVGRHGAERLSRLAAGIDDRAVSPAREEKSVSSETTLDEDLTSASECRRLLLALAGKVGTRIRAAGLTGRTVQVKIRTGAFRTYTRSRTLAHPLASDRALAEHARGLFDRWWTQQGPVPIRLLGVGLSQLAEEDQADLFEREDQEVDEIGDAVRGRFGGDALRPAALLDPPDRESS